MKRTSKITKKELAAVLRESVFAPNKPGPLKVIVDVGDPRYYMQRALELIVLSLQSPTVEQKRDYIGDAITLLGVAKHTFNVGRILDANTLAAIKDGDPQPDMETVKESLVAKYRNSQTQTVKIPTKPVENKAVEDVAVMGRSKIPGDS